MARDLIDEIVDELSSLHPAMDTTGLTLTGRILRVSRLLADRRARTLSDAGFSPGEFDVLVTLRRRQGRDGLQPTDLQRLILVSSGGLTKRLDGLEERGLLRRLPDPRDRRAVRVVLTDRGIEVTDALMEAVAATETALVTAALDPAEREAAAGALRRLLVHLEGSHPDP